jgi:hypothetical protein
MTELIITLDAQDLAALLKLTADRNAVARSLGHSSISFQLMAQLVLSEAIPEKADFWCHQVQLRDLPSTASKEAVAG